MMAKKKKDKFRKVQDWAKDFYFNKWRGREKVCPAFGEVVYVTRLGWAHLINPPKRRRKSEKLERLKALPLAKKLLETSTTYQEKRMRGPINYWSIEAVMSGTRIRVVVSSKGPRGRKIFYSVMILK